MTEKGMIFCMVKALLEKRKFSTMRLGGLKEVNAEPGNWEKPFYNKATGLWEFCHKVDSDVLEVKSPYQVGDRIYVKEGYQILDECFYGTYETIYGRYSADDSKFIDIQLNEHEWDLFRNRQRPHRPTSGRFMYKSLARIRFTITEIDIKRPQDLSEEDCLLEGIEELPSHKLGNYTIKESFEDLWEIIHGPGAWDRNEYCFRYKWKEIELCST